MAMGNKGQNWHNLRTEPNLYMIHNTLELMVERIRGIKGSKLAPI
jgi:hypothetical protein